MKRSAHLAGFAVLIFLGAAPVFGAAVGSVSGLVRDSAGVPQIGAEVQLLRPDLTVIACHEGSCLPARGKPLRLEKEWATVSR